LLGKTPVSGKRDKQHNSLLHEKITLEFCPDSGKI
jgi:hypothetical protein